MRFPEFIGEWGKTTLGNIGETFNGLTGKSGADFGQGSPYITYKSIFDNSRIDLSRVELVTITDQERQKGTQNKVQYGDIFFTTSSETPEEVGMTSVLLDDIEDCYLNSFCFGYRLYSKEHILPEYMRFYLRTQGVRKKLFVLAQGSTRFNISKGEVMNVSVAIPEIKEQEKIAKFLSLLEERIDTQIKIIEKLESLIRGIRAGILNSIQSNWVNLSELIKEGVVSLKRGNVIPKFEYSEEFCYPVYSSSVHNNGLMGYYKSFMFDCEIISWSIDGGGHFFYRPRHKFSVTNVCGYLELDTLMFNYRFVCEVLSHQHSKMIFDYQSKAHPSVIDTLYYLPLVPLYMQEKYAALFNAIYKKIETEKYCLKQYEEQKKFLLYNMFI